MQRITGPGQLKAGDRIKIVARAGKNSFDRVSIKDIVDNGYGEEVIINKETNIYFLTKNVMGGKSWAEKVFKLG